MTFRIEPLAPEDWARWRQVRVRALGEDPDAFACSAHVLGAQAPEQQWREAISTRRVLLAVDEHGRDVAMVGIVGDPDPELISMWVAPEARRSGLGRRLVDAVVGEAGDRDVTLRVMAQNTAAIAFYRGCGFELETRTPDAEGTLRMRRVAPSATTTWPAPAERPRRSGGPPPGRSADQ